MRMRSFSRVACVLLSGVVTLAVLGGPALAQTSIEVPQGSAFTVENGDECAANADVVISFTSPTREPTRIGSSVSDGSGHFSTQVTLPSTAVLGPATVLVDCGIGESDLLYDVAVVASTNTDLLSYAPYVIGGVLVLLGIMVLIGRRGSRDDVEVEPPDQSAAPVAEVAVPADDENDPDYWFWDAMTERGPVKRLACLTDTTFFLHEAPAEAFSALLEHLAVVGPDVALERAFFKVAVADIDEIRHRSTEIRINHRTAEGFVARTIDLATEVDGVIGLLSRRVPITADNPPPVGSM
jgi:hypothetical protein